MIHTPEPVARFMKRSSVSGIPSKDTSMERCKESMETKASAKEMFRKAISLADLLFLAFIHPAVASAILVKAYTAIASMIIK